MHHPLVKAFKGNASRSRIGKNRRRAPESGFVENRVVGLEGSFPIGHDEQSGTVPAEPRDLKISRILANVRIIKRALGMGFFQRAIVQHVVEDHGNAQRPDLDCLGRFVFEREAKDQLSSIQRPVARDLQRKIGRQSGSEVGRRQRIRGQPASRSRVCVPPQSSSSSMDRNCRNAAVIEVAKVKVAVLGSINEQVAGSEIESVRAFGLESRDGLRRTNQGQGEVRSVKIDRSLLEHRPTCLSRAFQVRDSQQQQDQQTQKEPCGKSSKLSHFLSKLLLRYGEC